MSTNQQRRDDDRRSDLAVMDANEYKQKRRLQRILDAHDRVEDIANAAWERYVSGEISAEAKDITIQKAVKQAIREAYNLLAEHANQQTNKDGDPVPDRYWYGRTDDRDEPGQAGIIGTIQREHDDPVVIRGLQDFLQSQPVYEETWQESVEQRHGPDGGVTRRETYTVPEELSWGAFLRLKAFLSREHDLEVRFEALEDQRPYDDWREEFENGVYQGPGSVDLPHKHAQE